MSVAQRLYEAGHITYMRTDSVNLSSLAINTISKVITDDLGAGYLKVRHYHTSSKGAQEAHEAIRPTYADKEHRRHLAGEAPVHADTPPRHSIADDRCRNQKGPQLKYPSAHATNVSWHRAK